MHVSTPEVTAYDLVRFPAAAGHLNNVATVLAELAEKIDGNKLAELAPKYSTPDFQRLGYLLDLVGQQDLTEHLLKALDLRRRRPVLLAPGEAANGGQRSSVRSTRGRRGATSTTCGSHSRLWARRPRR